MLDEPVPIEGIIEGEPEALAAVCAMGGPAVGAYCSVVGAEPYAAETMVAALAKFRRDVAGGSDREPAQLEALLCASTLRAVIDVAGVRPSRREREAAQAALEAAVTVALPPGLAPRIITALVAAAPVTALGGDVAAVRRAAEEHYARLFDGQAAGPDVAVVAPPAPVTGADPAAVPWSVPWSVPEPPLPESPLFPAVAPASWLPPQLLEAGPPAEHTHVESPDATDRALAVASADSQPHVPAGPVGLTEPAAPMSPPLPPGAEWRGGPARIWSRWRQRRQSRPSAVYRSSSLLVAGVLGLGVGAGAAFLAKPEKTVRPPSVIVRPLDTPFTVYGAAFNVARTNAALWALVIRRRPPRPGHVWLTLAVQTRNAGRANFHPRGLGYRLRTAAGIVIGPDTALASGTVSAAGGSLPIGKRASVHLGFQVRTALPDLALEFDGGARGPRIRVPLN